MKRFLLSSIVLAALAAAAFGQPAVDIHLFEIHRSDDGTVELRNPKNATHRPGYDNQPSFLPDGSGFLFTSIRPDNQADIYRYDLAEDVIHRVTTTPESEYSPTPIANGTRFSTVVVELDETQRLWSRNMQGGDPQVVLEDVKGIGYHAWANERLLALFVLGEPHELHVANADSQFSVPLAEDIGRSLQRIPETATISFMQHEGENGNESWWIRSVDPATREIATLTRAPVGAQDLSWTPWNSVWMTLHSEILEWTPHNEEWAHILDLSSYGLKDMTRLALSPDGKWLAVVALESAPEGG